MIEIFIINPTWNSWASYIILAHISLLHNSVNIKSWAIYCPMIQTLSCHHLRRLNPKSPWASSIMRPKINKRPQIWYINICPSNATVEFFLLLSSLQMWACFHNRLRSSQSICSLAAKLSRMLLLQRGIWIEFGQVTCGKVSTSICTVKCSHLPPIWLGIAHKSNVLARGQWQLVAPLSQIIVQNNVSLLTCRGRIKMVLVLLLRTTLVGGARGCCSAATQQINSGHARSSRHLLGLSHSLLLACYDWSLRVTDLLARLAWLLLLGLQIEIIICEMNASAFV